MTRPTSRIPGFYRLEMAERQRALGQLHNLTGEELLLALRDGGLAAHEADKIVENVVGTYSLPFGVALNVQINGRDYLAPMVVEEPSVVAAASNAARMVRASGGFEAEVVDALAIGQIQITHVVDAEGALARLASAHAELLELAARAAPRLVDRGGGPRLLEARVLSQDMIVVHVLVDCLDAMGANLINGIVEAIGDTVAAVAGGRLGLRILSNLNDRRRVRARCRVGSEELVRRADGSFEPWPAEDAVDAIASASRFAELDPYRAATHNKGIMNGIDAVVAATGNDYRAVEAGAHAYAARSGQYRPLAVWRREGVHLVGELELPLALGTIGGAMRVHRGARLALRLLNVESAGELALVAACVGLASNLAALRALATEGIQRGHMALHARSVALAAGAVGAEIEAVARRIAAARCVNEERAVLVLAELRAAAQSSSATSWPHNVPLS